ncbi:hypothetical protein [Dyadobacter sp. CY312]|uniref:hypothetical protein n=1 Tax=Dyadobacter sp. CY312 TaxID=2907303 RepID=UPI001F490759|nr:hypothetical protein [Dyadobacter sp. CY312]MCE7040145.1 hypothetical protein [Dyadobacter sp. CY312]
MNEPIYALEGGTLIVKPYVHQKRLSLILSISGIPFLLLAVFCWLKMGDFWQLPLAIALGLLFFAVFMHFQASTKATFSRETRKVHYLMSGLIERKSLPFDDVLIAARSRNGRTYYALVDRNNPYGDGYAISPFYANKRKQVFYEQDTLPVIECFLKQPAPRL